MSFGEDVFGGPRWIELVGKERAADYQKAGTVPLMLDADGAPMRRNFVHVDDLVDAILKSLDHPGARQQTFNICMDEPVDYGAVAAHLQGDSRPAVGGGADRVSQHLAGQFEGEDTASAGARAMT